MEAPWGTAPGNGGADAAAGEGSPGKLGAAGLPFGIFSLAWRRTTLRWPRVVRRAERRFGWIATAAGFALPFISAWAAWLRGLTVAAAKSARKR